MKWGGGGLVHCGGLQLERRRECRHRRKKRTCCGRRSQWHGGSKRLAQAVEDKANWRERGTRQDVGPGPRPVLGPEPVQAKRSIEWVQSREEGDLLSGRSFLLEEEEEGWQ